jgi:hypothetical protein
MKSPAEIDDIVAKQRAERAALDTKTVEELVIIVGARRRMVLAASSALEKIRDEQTAAGYAFREADRRLEEAKAALCHAAENAEASQMETIAAEAVDAPSEVTAAEAVDAPASSECLDGCPWHAKVPA